VVGKPESTDWSRPADEKAGKLIQVDDQSQRGVESPCGPLRRRGGPRRSGGVLGGGARRVGLGRPPLCPWSQVTMTTARRLAREEAKRSAHGQRWGMCNVNLRADEVSRPGARR
jgi:hypothetical protein